MATLPPSLPRSRATGLPFDTRGRSQRERAQARAAARLHVPQVRGSTRKRYRLLGETVEAAPTTRTSRRREEKRRASMAGSADQAARMAAWRARSSRRRRWQVEASGAGGSIECWWKHREAGEKRGGSCAAAEEGMRDASRCAHARCRVPASQTSRAAREGSHEPAGGSIGAWEHGQQCSGICSCMC